jgi:Ser/Thr protein kinase RdoA (MazF antagonist)
MTWGDTLRSLQDDTVARASALWGTEALERVSLSANVVHRLADGNYLRLVHSRLRDEEFLAAGVDWARGLAAQGASVSTALESARGNLIEVVDDGWLATVWRGIVGEPLTDAMTTTQLEAWGEAAGRLHSASVVYTPKAVRTSSQSVLPERFFLRRFWANIEATVSKDAELLEMYRRLTPLLEALPEPEMLICHGDFRPANAIWDGARVWVVDFDEPVLAWAEYDVARAMSRDHEGVFPNLKTHLDTFRRGYERGRGEGLNVPRLELFVQVQALLSLSWSLEDASWGWTHDLRRLALETFHF